MTIAEFFQSYDGHHHISINGYCNEEMYDYYTIPDRVENDEDMEDFVLYELSGNNPNKYVPSCLFQEPWWEEIKDQEIAHWNIIGGDIRELELVITLEDNICTGTETIEEYKNMKSKMEELAAKASSIHRNTFDIWEHGDIAKIWFDHDKNLCIEYESGQWWHYNERGEWW